MPLELASFDASDWPGRDWQARFDAWRHAQDTHTNMHGWPGGPLDLLARRIVARRRHYGSPLPLGVTDHLGMPAERVRPTAQRAAPQG